MDYLLFSTLIGIVMCALLVSYDIACQYYKNLFRRMAQYPPRLRIDNDATDVRYAIPKKHYAVHGPKHSRFSLNFLFGAARIVGEGCEVAWSHMNPVALSTREMAPSFRREVLDAHWGAWNWQKTVHLGM